MVLMGGSKDQIDWPNYSGVWSGKEGRYWDY